MLNSIYFTVHYVLMYYAITDSKFTILLTQIYWLTFLVRLLDSIIISISYESLIFDRLKILL